MDEDGFWVNRKFRCVLRKIDVRIRKINRIIRGFWVSRKVDVRIRKLSPVSRKIQLTCRSFAASAAFPNVKKEDYLI